MINLTVVEDSSPAIKRTLIKKAARRTLLENKVKPFATELTITITTNDEIQALNKTYRGMDAVTDVLSFEADLTNPESGKNYLGDIIISYPVAQSQAITAGHSVDTEICVLVIHGILHLLGYDHDTEEVKQTMWSMQERIFSKIHLKPKQLPED